jgi:Holliday junction DNA helicase RuvA
MIGRISGQILEKSMDFVLIDVSGVAYEIQIPHTTYYRLEPSTDAVTLHTHMVVREDAQLLYGFYTQSERALFRALIKVNKVGPKVAIAILSSVETSAFVRCVRDKDVKTLNAIPGVGRVMAERLIVEMSSKLSEWEIESGPVVTGGGAVKKNDLLADAESALVGLGFKPQEASLALAQLKDPAENVEALIKQALKALA